MARSTVTGSRPAPVETLPPATQIADLLQAGVIGSPVLFVNDQTVTIPEVLEPIIDDLRRKARILPERDYVNELLGSLREQVDQRISTLLIYEEARQKFSDKKIQEAFDKRIDLVVADIVNKRYEGVYARYEAHLKAIDYTAAENKERLKREIIVNEYLRERFRPMIREPSRRELLAYYEQRVADLSTPPKAELFTIEVPIAAELKKPLQQAGPGEIESARRSAREQILRAREEIESGIDFATVAKAYSRGLMASQGGAWGEITPGSLTKRWAKPGEAVFTLSPGQMTVVETDEAVFLVRCGKKTPGHRPTFEEAQKVIVNQILDEQFVKLRTDYIIDLIKRATISKRPEFTRALLAVVPRPPRKTEDNAGGLLNPGG